MESLTNLPVTILFVALFALVQIPVTMAVGFRRAKTGIQFMDGGDRVLLKRMRAHGNFTETVPMALFAMAAAELSGAPAAASSCLSFGIPSPRRPRSRASIALAPAAWPAAPKTRARTAESASAARPQWSGKRAKAPCRGPRNRPPRLDVDSA